MPVKNKGAVGVIAAGLVGILMIGTFASTTATLSSVGGVVAAISEASGADEAADYCDETRSNDTSSTVVTAVAGGNLGQTAYVRKFAKYAERTGKKYNIPPEAILAQGGFESGWGLSAPGNNHFGIKAWSGCKRGATTGTTEDFGGYVSTTATWCAYDNDQEGWDAYGVFIRGNSRYDNSLQYKTDPYKYLETIWKDGYATDGAYMSKISPIVDMIMALNEKEKLFTPAKQLAFDEWRGTPSAGNRDNGSNDTSGTAVAASCKTSESGNAVDGKLGDAPSKGGNYAWMCKGAGVCVDGDGLGEKSSDRNFYKHNVGRYQCVWYAWNRLAMIHGDKGWGWLIGNGGQISGKAATTQGWSVSKTPKAGDGVSQFGGALGGDGTYGHIAVVEEVKNEADGWRIRISEGNFGTGGNGAWTGYNSRWLTQKQFDGAGSVFFRNDGWKN